MVILHKDLQVKSLDHMWSHLGRKLEKEGERHAG